MIKSFWKKLFRKLFRIRGQSEDNPLSNPVGARVSIEPGKEYCYLKSNKPDGDGLVVSSNSIVTQVHWNEGMIDGNVIIANLADYSFVFVGNVTDSFITLSKDLSMISEEIIDLDESGNRWEGQVLDGIPFGWGSLYDGASNICYKGFRIGNHNVCYGTIYHSHCSSSHVYYEGNLCNSLKWGWGSLYDLKDNCLYQGVFLNNSNEFKELSIPSQSISVENFHSFVEDLIIGDHACVALPTFIIESHLNLRKIIIGALCYSEKHEDETRFSLIDLPQLEILKIGMQSFEYFTQFTMRNLPRLKQLSIGERDCSSYCFKYCPKCCLLDMPQLQKLELSDYVFSHLEMCILGNLTMLQSIVLGDHALNGSKSITGKSVVGLLSSFRNTSLILKDLPSLETLISTGEENFNNFGVLSIQNIPKLRELQLQSCFMDIGSFNVFNAESFKSFVGMNNGYGIFDV